MSKKAGFLLITAFLIRCSSRMKDVHWSGDTSPNITIYKYYILYSKINLKRDFAALEEERKVLKNEGIQLKEKAE